MTFTESLCGGLDGIVIDAVGTLMEPVPSVSAVYAAAAAEQGVVLDRDLVRRRFARHFRVDEDDDRAGPMTTDEAREHARWRRIVADVLPEVPQGDRAFATLWAHFARPDAWRVFDDVPEAIRRLANAGLRLAVGSNFDGRLRGVVDGLPGLRAIPTDHLVISSEVGHRKPHPAFYAAACRRLGLEPARVLCVGDDPENDVAGARRAGLLGVWLDRNGTGTESPEWPRITSLTELADAFEAARR